MEVGAGGGAAGVGRRVVPGPADPGGARSTTMPRHELVKTATSEWRPERWGLRSPNRVRVDGSPSPLTDLGDAATVVGRANILAWWHEPRARRLMSVLAAESCVLALVVVVWPVLAGNRVTLGSVGAGLTTGIVVFVAFPWLLAVATPAVLGRRLLLLRDQRGSACLFVSPPRRRPNRTRRHAPDAWLVESFAAHPPRLGLGRDLLGALTAWADHYRLPLVLQAATEDVRRFYEGSGFEACEGTARIMVRKPLTAAPPEGTEPGTPPRPAPQ